ncbi:MAG TPA: hypothetical protein PK950_01090 [Candidatus Paceibacterota bacterium]|nr:hypothetical protein [Candidatus Paceibacterota bacterium]
MKKKLLYLFVAWMVIHSTNALAQRSYVKSSDEDIAACKQLIKEASVLKKKLKKAIKAEVLSCEAVRKLDIAYFSREDLRNVPKEYWIFGIMEIDDLDSAIISGYGKSDTAYMQVVYPSFKVEFMKKVDIKVKGIDGKKHEKKTVFVSRLQYIYSEEYNIASEQQIGQPANMVYRHERMDDLFVPIPLEELVNKEDSRLFDAITSGTRYKVACTDEEKKQPTLPQFSVGNDTTHVVFFDPQKVDGDMVAIYVDGKLIKESLELGKQAYTLAVYVPANTKRIVSFKALSEGTQSPCTVQARIVENNQLFKLNIRKGKSAEILLFRK